MEIDEALSAVGRDLMDQAPRLTADIFEFAKQLDGYRDVSPETILPISEPAIRYLIQTLFLDHRDVSEEDLALMRGIAETRAQLGIPLHTLLTHIPRAQQSLWDAASESVVRLGLGPEVMSRITRLLVDFTVAFAREVAEVYRQIEVDAARSDEGRRTRVLHDLLFGDPPGVHDVELAAYQLDRTTSYIAFRGRASSDTTTPALRRALEGAGSPLVGFVGGDLAGVLARPPVLDVDGVVGLGPPTSLLRIAHSYRIASRSMEVADSFGLRGAFAIEDLGLRVPIASEDTLGDHLVGRYLAPLEAMRDNGASVRETLRALFAHGMSVDVTAREMSAHPNTLRYRLRRFEELTGADLTRTEDLFEVWWALQRESLTNTVER